MTKTMITQPRVLATGALIVLVDDTERVLILLRPSSAYWAPTTWGYPGGKIEDGETPHDAAIRETKEETELDAINIKKIGLKTDFPCVPYYTREYSGTVKIDHEHEDWRWVSRSEIESYPLAPGVLEMLDWVLQND